MKKLSKKFINTTPNNHLFPLLYLKIILAALSYISSLKNNPLKSLKLSTNWNYITNISITNLNLKQIKYSIHLYMIICSKIIISKQTVKDILKILWEVFKKDNLCFTTDLYFINDLNTFYKLK